MLVFTCSLRILYIHTVYIHHTQPNLYLPSFPIFSEHNLPPAFISSFSFCIPLSPVITEHVCMDVAPTVACMPSFLCGCWGIKLNPHVWKQKNKKTKLSYVWAIPPAAFEKHLSWQKHWSSRVGSYAVLRIVIFKHRLDSALNASRAATNLHLLISLVQCLTYHRNLINT